MKEIVAKIFGKEVAEDEEIVAFYEDVQKIAMEEYAKEYHEQQVKANSVLGDVSESFSPKQSHKVRTLLKDFYMWMQENDYDHNIPQRVENKAELFLREKNVR